MRTTRLSLLAVLVTLLLLTNSARADKFTYAVNNHFSDFQVDGTITTDSNAGVLLVSNILDFSLLLSTGGQSEALTFANAANMGVIGDAFTATDTGLFFDYGVSGAAIYLQNTATGTYLCYQTAYCDSADADAHQSISLSGAVPAVQSQSGQVQIGSIVSSTAVTPEPPGLLLLATGVIASIVVVRRQQA